MSETSKKSYLISRDSTTKNTISIGTVHNEFKEIQKKELTSKLDNESDKDIKPSDIATKASLNTKNSNNFFIIKVRSNKHFIANKKDSIKLGKIINSRNKANKFNDIVDNKIAPFILLVVLTLAILSHISQRLKVMSRILPVLEIINIVITMLLIILSIASIFVSLVAYKNKLNEINYRNKLSMNQTNNNHFNATSKKIARNLYISSIYKLMSSTIVDILFFIIEIIELLITFGFINLSNIPLKLIASYINVLLFFVYIVNKLVCYILSEYKGRNRDSGIKKSIISCMSTYITLVLLGVSLVASILKLLSVQNIISLDPIILLCLSIFSLISLFSSMIIAFIGNASLDCKKEESNINLRMQLLTYCSKFYPNYIIGLHSNAQLSQQMLNEYILPLERARNRIHTLDDKSNHQQQEQSLLKRMRKFLGGDDSDVIKEDEQGMLYMANVSQKTKTDFEQKTDIALPNNAMLMDILIINLELMARLVKVDDNSLQTLKQCLAVEEFINDAIDENNEFLFSPQNKLEFTSNISQFYGKKANEKAHMHH